MLTLTKSQEDFLSFIAHPLANMFPMIEGNAFEELKRDIAAQGILEPIRLYQGMILDGRNRYAAAKACGHQFSVDDFVQWEGSLADAEAWVISTNLHRRQLTTKQKQDLIMDMVKRNPSLSDREIARQIGVSNSTVGAARDRLTNSPEVRRDPSPRYCAHCGQRFRQRHPDQKFCRRWCRLQHHAAEGRSARRLWWREGRPMLNEPVIDEPKALSEYRRTQC
jgi:hypothetical protein